MVAGMVSRRHTRFFCEEHRWPTQTQLAFATPELFNNIPAHA